MEVTEDWEVIDHPECLTLTLNDEGALQVSSARKQTGTVTLQDLLYPADEREAWGNFRRTTCGDFDGIMHEYESDGIAWRRWFVAKEQILLFITYNATPQGAQREYEAVIKVLNKYPASGVHAVRPNPSFKRSATVHVPPIS